MSNTPQNEREARRYRVSPQDILAFQRRAYEVLHLPTIHEQAHALYPLYLDFLRAGLMGRDFSRWLSRHSGRTRMTCHNRVRLMLAFTVTQNHTASQRQLLAELRQWEQTPANLPALPGLTWDEPPKERRKPRAKHAKQPRPTQKVQRGLVSWAKHWAVVGWKDKAQRPAQAHSLLQLRQMWQGSRLGRSFASWFARETNIPLRTVWWLISESETLRRRSDE